jgi:hypothetical protein
MTEKCKCAKTTQNETFANHMMISGDCLASGDKENIEKFPEDVDETKERSRNCFGGFCDFRSENLEKDSRIGLKIVFRDGFIWTLNLR